MTTLATTAPIPNEAERKEWLREVPELAGLFETMPERPGKIDVHYNWMPNGILLLVTLTDSSEESPEWWWHESIYLQTPFPSRVTTRLIIAHERIAHLEMNGGELAKQNVIHLADYMRPQAVRPA